MSYYLILSLSHSTKSQPCWWRANAEGFTNSIATAGKYTSDKINSEPEYYNNGKDTLAIPFSDFGLASIGYLEKFDLKKVKALSNVVEKGKKEVRQ